MRSGIVEDSFLIKGYVIIILLRHSENGQPAGTKLIDDHGTQWTIRARRTHWHVEHVHFENELEITYRSVFRGFKAREESKLKIEEREARNVFEYNINLHPEDARPVAGTHLTIQLPLTG